MDCTPSAAQFSRRGTLAAIGALAMLIVQNLAGDGENGEGNKEGGESGEKPQLAAREETRGSDYGDEGDPNGAGIGGRLDAPPTDYRVGLRVERTMDSYIEMRVAQANQWAMASAILLGAAAVLLTLAFAPAGVTLWLAYGGAILAGAGLGAGFGAYLRYSEVARLRELQALPGTSMP